MNYFKLLYITLFLLVLGCKSSKIHSNDSYLFIVSKNDNLSYVKSMIYIEPLQNDKENKYKIDSLGYIYRFLFYSKDGYVLIPCCVFKQVNNLSLDTEKLLTEIPEKEFDSLSKYYGKKQKTFYQDLPQITNIDRGYKVKNETHTLRVFKANSIKYCECSYGYQYSGMTLPDGSEAFITELNKIEELTPKEESFINSNFDKVLSNKIIEEIIK